MARLAAGDGVQVAAAALGALGTEDEPTDLALALDHRIQHILVIFIDFDVTFTYYPKVFSHLAIALGN